MSTEDIIARVSTTIDAPATKVWEALVTPKIIKHICLALMWSPILKLGVRIKWKGEWEGKRYEDKGEIREFTQNHLLQYTHFSPLTGQEDIPENYHIVTITLVEKDGKTNVTLTQDNNPTDKAKRTFGEELERNGGGG
ncbi:MAG: SRPBCC domain-containing protein [Bacteroidota bacterium]